MAAGNALDVKIARAREVLSGATRGPWGSNLHGEVRAVALDGLSIGFFSRSFSVGAGGSHEVTAEGAVANAQSSALAVNAISALLNLAEAARRHGEARRHRIAGQSYDTETNVYLDGVVSDAVVALDAALAGLAEVLP